MDQKQEVTEVKVALKPKNQYGLRPARTPKVHDLLSGVVYVVDSHGKGFAYIHFDEQFVTAVGSVMPTGLSPDNPALLKVVHMHGSKVWRIFAKYLHDSRMVLLWESSTQPAWLAKLYREPRVSAQDGRLNHDTIQ